MDQVHDGSSSSFSKHHATSNTFTIILEPETVLTETEQSCQDKEEDSFESVCSICLRNGEIVGKSSICLPTTTSSSGELVKLETGNHFLWRLFKVFSNIITTEELLSKIELYFPHAPHERLREPNALICTPCYNNILLQVDKSIVHLVQPQLVVINSADDSYCKSEHCESNVIRPPVSNQKCAQNESISNPIVVEYHNERHTAICEDKGVDKSRGKCLGKTSLEGKKKNLCNKVDVPEIPASNLLVNVNRNPNLENSAVERELHDSTKFFCCPKCCRYFTKDDYTIFKNHIQNHCLIKKRFPCSVCSKIYTTQNVLDYHQENVHANPHPKSMRTKPRKESTAMENNNNSSKNSRHETSSAADKPSQIKIKKDEWPDDEVEAEKMAMEKGVWKCYICFYESRQKSLWSTHLSRLHPDVLGITLSCDTCNFNFVKKYHLREHINEVHADSIGYKCDDCGRKFSYRNGQHICEKIKCEICHLEFATRGLKSKHLLIHSEYRPFHCEVCPKKFQKREYLSMHMRVHNDIRPYPCAYCDKSFRSKSHYNNHRRIHTGEKPYVCQSCEKSFYSPQCLYNHITSHTGIKNYSCGNCDKSFRTSNDLKRHMFIHTGERPYSCKYCKRSFNRRGNCLVHERAHEATEKSLQCDLCTLTFDKPMNLENHKVSAHSANEGVTSRKTFKAKPRKCAAGTGSSGGKTKNISTRNINDSETDKVQEQQNQHVISSQQQSVTLIHVEDIASNVEISEEVMCEQVIEDPINLYQLSFEIGETTLYCIEN